MKVLLATAFRLNVTAGSLTALAWNTLAPHFLPIILCGGVLVLVMIAGQLASTRMGIAGSKLAPDFKRLNFLSRITQLPGQNFPIFLQALVIIPIAGLVVYYEVTENLGLLLELPWVAPTVAIGRVGSVLETLLWRSAAVFLVIGVIDLFWQRHRYTKQLRMSKQEVREESKEQEGSPHLKARIRRLQRDLSRRRMMKDVPTATAVTAFHANSTNW